MYYPNTLIRARVSDMHATLFSLLTLEIVTCRCCTHAVPEWLCHPGYTTRQS